MLGKVVATPELRFLGTVALHTSNHHMRFGTYSVVPRVYSVPTQSDSWVGM